MHNKLLISSAIGFIVVSILGTLGHFVYDWTGENVFAGFLFPVNESTWEHMKLAFFPMLLYFFLENLLHQKKNKEPFDSLCADLVSILIATFSIPILFYTYSGILGQNYSPIDISIYYISIFLAFLFRYICLKRDCQIKYCEIITTLILLLALGFVVFTYDPPALGIFS